MFTIKVYEDENGNSPVNDYLDELHSQAATNKDSRVRISKILRYFGLLETYGARVGLPASKHIEDNIWELRPMNDRFFYAYWKDDTFIILHHFKKNTQKTPPAEIKKAKQILKEFLGRGD